MTIRNNCVWLFEGQLTAKAVVVDDQRIVLTMLEGVDPDGNYSIGDTWLWENSEEVFLHCWSFVRELEPEEIPLTKLPLTETWLIVCRFADGVDFHNGFFSSREEAQQAYDEEPYDTSTGEPVELLDIIRVPYYG